MVKAIKFTIEDPDKHFIASSTTFSPIGVGTILERLDGYIEDVKETAEKLSMIIPNGGDLQSLYGISTIRDRSIEMLTGIELLKASLDRFVCAEEDIKKPRSNRRRLGLGGRVIHGKGRQCRTYRRKS